MALLLIVGTILLGVFLYKIRKDYFILSLAKKIKTVDGSDINDVAPTAEGSSIFGNNLDFIGASNEEMFMWTRRKAIKYRKSFLQYMIATPVYNIITPEDAEIVFNDVNLITKGMVYRFMKTFVGTGLLTSTGQKWHSRRKMLTPAFHFNILEQFVEIFKEESQKFVDLLEKKDGQVISLTDMIPRLTLNTICETALGVKLDNLKDGDTYRKHLDGIEQAIVERTSNPLYFSEFLWKFLGKGNKFQVHYDGVHKFSSDIIEKKRALFKKMENSNENSNEADGADDIFFSKKRRYAMLDTLLMAEKEGRIDHDGICEEVDTFIFEGFDTTSMGLMYGIMTLAQYPEIQQKCFEEVDSMIDDDLKNLTTAQINKLEYLERFVKETLRLYPSVPTIIREVTRDTALSNNIFLPKGAQILIHIYDINRHPKHYENPDQFDPDRFLPQNSKGRHPYSYVPFSAGSRNCIGQKFALYEMKTVLIHFLKNFQAFQIQDPKECRYEFGFLLRVTHNIEVRIEKRKT